MATAHVTAPFAFTSKFASAPLTVFKPDPIDLHALISQLTPDQLAESFSIECFRCPPQMFRRIWSHLGPQQQAFLDVIVWSGDETLEKMKEELSLGSVTEAEQVLADLRTQLRGMAISPQEVYHADYRITEMDGKLVAHYHANWPFMEAHQREFNSNWRKQRELRDEWVNDRCRSIQREQ